MKGQVAAADEAAGVAGAGLALLLAGSVVYLVVAAALGPLSGNVDTFAFKDAAANLALGQGFTTVFNFGNPTAATLVYAGHPPAYPFLSGLWFSLFGVSVESNSLFEDLLRVVLALVLWLAVAPSVARRWRWLLALLLVLGLPAGMTGLMHDRPDVLALILAIAAPLPLGRRPDRRGAAGSALLAGLALTVSPIGGILAVLGIGAQWLLAGPGRPSLLAMAVIGATGLLLPMTAIVLSLWSVDPTYPARLFGFVQDGGGWIAGQDSAGLGFVSLLFRDPALLLQKVAASFTTVHHWANLAVLLAVAAAIVHAVATAPWKEAPRGRAGRALAFLVLSLFLFLCVVVFGWNRGYPTVFALVLIALYARIVPSSRGGLPVLLPLALGVLLSAPLTGIGLVQRAAMADSLQRMELWLGQHPLPDADGDGRVVVALDPASHLLFRNAGYDTLVWWQPSIATDELLARADAFAFSFNGTGDADQAAYPAWWTPALGTLLYRPALPQVPRLFGVALSRSSKTWEVELWRARPR